MPIINICRKHGTATIAYKSPLCPCCNLLALAQIQARELKAYRGLESAVFDVIQPEPKTIRLEGIQPN